MSTRESNSARHLLAFAITQVNRPTRDTCFAFGCLVSSQKEKYSFGQFHIVSFLHMTYYTTCFLHTLRGCPLHYWVPSRLVMFHHPQKSCSCKTDIIQTQSRQFAVKKQLSDCNSIVHPLTARTAFSDVEHVVKAFLSLVENQSR